MRRDSLCFSILLSWLTVMVAAGDDCKVTGEYITLGEYFSLTSEELYAPGSGSHMITVGLISNCSAEPELEIMELGEFGEAIETTKITPSESKPFDGQAGDGHFAMKAFYFFISQKLIEKSAGWRVASEAAREWKMWPVGAGTKIEPVAKMLIVGEWMFSDGNDLATSIFNKEKFGWPHHDILVQFEDHAPIDSPQLDKDISSKYEGISSLASSLLYIEVPANNDHSWNSRLRMPGQTETLWANKFFDFVYQGIYYLVVDWQHLLTRQPKDTERVFTWMQTRFKMTESRADIEWRLVLSGTPLLCNELQLGRDCSANIYYLKMFDDLMTKYRVDVMISSQIDEYARFKPMYNFGILNDSSQTIPSIKDGIHRPYLQILVGKNSTGNDDKSLFVPFIDKLDHDSQCYLEVNFTATQMIGTAWQYRENSKVVDSWSKFRQYRPVHRLSTIILLISLFVIVIAVLSPYAYDLVISWYREKDYNSRMNDYPLVSITPDRHDNYKSIELDTLKSQSPPKDIVFKDSSFLKPDWRPKLSPAD